MTQSLTAGVVGEPWRHLLDPLTKADQLQLGSVRSLGARLGTAHLHSAFVSV